MEKKPWYKSWTIVGGALLAAVKSLEVVGAIPAGGMETLASLAQNIAGLMALYGVRRAINPNV